MPTEVASSPTLKTRLARPRVSGAEDLRLAASRYGLAFGAAARRNCRALRTCLL